MVVTTDEYAQLVGVSRRAVTECCKNGSLEFGVPFRVGRKWKIVLNELLEREYTKKFGARE